MRSAVEHARSGTNQAPCGSSPRENRPGRFYILSGWLHHRPSALCRSPEHHGDHERHERQRGEEPPRAHLPGIPLKDREAKGHVHEDARRKHQEVTDAAGVSDQYVT